MFLVAVVVVALLTAPLFGGRLTRLAEVRLRWSPLLGAALAVQIVIISVVPDGPDALYRVLHLLTYAAAGTFLWVNRSVAGLWIVAVGAALNALVITVNGGVMPASAAALRAAGQSAAHGEFANSTTLSHARLGFLGDVFSLPSWVPLHNVFSIGDVCIALGAAIAIHHASGARLPLGRRARTRLDLSDSQR